MLRPLVTALKSSRSLRTIVATLTMLILSTLTKDPSAPRRTSKFSESTANTVFPGALNLFLVAGGLINAHENVHGHLTELRFEEGLRSHRSWQCFFRQF